MSEQETDLQDIYNELIIIKDALDKIKDICEAIIEYDLEKNPSTIDTNINLLKQDISDLGSIHIKDLENIRIRNECLSQIGYWEQELSTYNKQISDLWYKYILLPPILENNIIINQNLIAKNTCVTLKASRLLRFYYDIKQRIKEIYETYKDQEHIADLLRDIDEEYMDIIYEHHQQDFIDKIEEKDKIIEEKNEMINLLKKKLENASNSNERLLNTKKKLLARIRLLEDKQVPTADLLDTNYNPFDNLY